jgi:hypothetical protein
VRFLIDANFPSTLAAEAPAGVEMDRWDGSDETDEAVVRAAARDGYRGVVFLDRRSLDQPRLRQLALDLGVALVAVDASDPVEAKERLLANLNQLRSALLDSELVLVLNSEARAL